MARFYMLIKGKLYPEKLNQAELKISTTIYNWTQPKIKLDKIK
jgi:hypothetical protein